MNTPIDESLWSDLEGSEINDEGYVRRRLIPEGKNDVFIAVRFPDRERQIIFSFEETVTLGKMAATALVEPEVLLFENGSGGEIRFRLKSNEGRSVFSSFCNDLVSEFQIGRDRLIPINRVVKRFELWRLLLSPEGKEGLSRPRQQGLLGELLFLEELLDSTQKSRAIASWRGPLHDSIDFILEGVGIEVKTTAGLRPLKVKISSEKQLSDEGLGTLLLNVYELTSRQDGSGQSLNDIASRIARKLDGEDLSIFKDLLISSGYIEPHLKKYDSTFYTVLQTLRYQVMDAFPRLTNSSLPPGLGNISYDLYLDACEQFRIRDNDLRKYLQSHE